MIVVIMHIMLRVSQVTPKAPFADALYYLRGRSGVEVHTGDELLEHYFETEGPRKHSMVVSWGRGKSRCEKLKAVPSRTAGGPF
jgi:hypothetical protein